LVQNALNCHGKNVPDGKIMTSPINVIMSVSELLIIRAIDCRCCTCGFAIQNSPAITIPIRKVWVWQSALLCRIENLYDTISTKL